MSSESPELEFSVELDLAKISREGRTTALHPSPKERTRIAKRLKVIDISALSGEITLSATKKSITAVGRVKSTLTRECVASLEEMEEIVDEAFEVEFLRHAPEPNLDEDIEDWELPEVYEGQVFDIGELMVQQLSLAMKPFPRKEGAVSLAELYGDGGSVSPFAGLADRFGKKE
ncbi:MAG: metal-binding protein [Hyphococcus sp.]|nr:MAG: metal-binding protein [Marinicaulis sp.]